MNSHSDHTLHFEAVNSRNRAEVEHLEVFAEQSGFIESVTQCLQEADKLELWRPIGIYDRGMLIGFAMYGYFPEPAPGQVWLDRLLIDKKYQGKGFGRQTLDAAMALICTYPFGKADKVWLSYEPENVRAREIYRKYGFVENGEMCGNEIIAVYDL